jgi:hypothetical protein
MQRHHVQHIADKIHSYHFTTHKLIGTNDDEFTSLIVEEFSNLLGCLRSARQCTKHFLPLLSSTGCIVVSKEKADNIR